MLHTAVPCVQGILSYPFFDPVGASLAAWVACTGFCCLLY
jgi:hypothetical protein